jgi:hypothetical protein
MSPYPEAGPPTPSGDRAPYLHRHRALSRRDLAAPQRQIQKRLCTAATIPNHDGAEGGGDVGEWLSAAV